MICSTGIVSDMASGDLVINTDDIIIVCPESEGFPKSYLEEF